MKNFEERGQGDIHDSNNTNEIHQSLVQVEIEKISDANRKERKEIDPEDLYCLAESIETRGQISAVSLRDDPEHEDHFLVN